MKRYFLRTLLSALTIALLLTACGQQSNGANTDPDDAPPDAQPGNLYEDFFAGSVTATANLINAGVEASTASFRAPDVYAAAGADGSDMDWTITRFALLDLDGDGTDEPVLAINYHDNEEYVVLTCYDGAVYANQVVYRGFLTPKSDGTVSWSNGAFDNGYARFRFENGVLVYDDFAAVSSDDSGSVIYTLNGESVSEEDYNAFIAEQDAKDDLAWTDFTVEAVSAALAG